MICNNYNTFKIYNITRHVRKHTGEKPFECNSCPYAAKQRGSLNKHIERYHNDTFKSFWIITFLLEYMNQLFVYKKKSYLSFGCVCVWRKDCYSILDRFLKQFWIWNQNKHEFHSNFYFYSSGFNLGLNLLLVQFVTTILQTEKTMLFDMANWNIQI